MLPFYSACFPSLGQQRINIIWGWGWGVMCVSVCVCWDILILVFPFVFGIIFVTFIANVVFCFLLHIRRFSPNFQIVLVQFHDCRYTFGKAGIVQYLPLLAAIPHLSESFTTSSGNSTSVIIVYHCWQQIHICHNRLPLLMAIPHLS